MKRARGAIMALLALLAVGFAAAGCAGPSSPGNSAQVSQPSTPAPAVLTSPKSAVTSYMDWVTYAYRIGDSDVATNTMSEDEEVRVNSFVELNTEQQRRISQVLTSFKPGPASVEGTHATLGASEVWEYRYLSVDGAAAVSPTYTASYEATYNVILVRPKTWVVDSVDVRALGEVK